MPDPMMDPQVMQMMQQQNPQMGQAQQPPNPMMQMGMGGMPQSGLMPPPQPMQQQGMGMQPNPQQSMIRALLGGQNNGF